MIQSYPTKRRAELGKLKVTQLSFTWMTHSCWKVWLLKWAQTLDPKVSKTFKIASGQYLDVFGHIIGQTFWLADQIFEWHLIMITYSLKEVYPQCALLTWGWALSYEMLRSYRESYIRSRLIKYYLASKQINKPISIAVQIHSTVEV